MRSRSSARAPARLRDMLNIFRGELTAVVGAGGKTGTMNRLAREFKYRGVIYTTTTALLVPEELPFRLKIVKKAGAFREAVREYGKNPGKSSTADSEMLVIGSGLVRARPGSERRMKLKGVDQNWTAEVSDELSSLVMLVEADGAASHSIKFPADHEPALPAGLDNLLVVQGAAAAGRELSSPHCFRSHLQRSRRYASLALYRELFAGDCGYGPYLRGSHESHLILSQLEGEKRDFFRRLCFELKRYRRGSPYSRYLALNYRTGSVGLHTGSFQG